jgi:hypothetical protein
VSVARWERWLAAAALLVAAFGLGRVGVLNIVAPVDQAERVGMLLDNAMAVSNARVAIGGFHLGLAVIAVACLVSPRWRQPGLGFIAALISTVVAVRLFSVAADGAEPRLLSVLGAETVTWLLLMLGWLAECRLARHERRDHARRLA